MTTQGLLDRVGLPPGTGRVVIIGCGTLGSVLARGIVDAGHRVWVIDIQKDALDSLPSEPVRDGRITPLIGDGSSEGDLINASARDADLVVATTGSDVNNALVAQMAMRLFGVDRAICRYDEPSGRELYEELGIITVSGSELMASAILGTQREF